MDWTDTPEQAEFRAEVRSMISNSLPERYQRGEGPPERTWEFDRGSSDTSASDAAREWHSALSNRKWVAPQWPVEYGGAGLSSMEQFILNQELARAGAPGVGGSGVSMLGPTPVSYTHLTLPTKA